MPSVASVVSPQDQVGPGPIRVVGHGEWAEAEKPEREVHYEFLKPVLEKLPNVFTSDIWVHIWALAFDEEKRPRKKKLKKAITAQKNLETKRLKNKYANAENESDSEEMITPRNPVVDLPGAHTKVMLSQGIHIRYNEILPPGTILPRAKAAAPMPAYRPPQLGPPRPPAQAIVNARHVLAWVQQMLVTNQHVNPLITLQFIHQFYPRDVINGYIQVMEQAFPQLWTSTAASPLQIALEALPVYAQVVAPAPVQVQQPVQRAPVRTPLAPRSVPNRQNVTHHQRVLPQRRVPLQQRSVSIPASPSLTNSSSDDSDDGGAPSPVVEIDLYDSMDAFAFCCLGDGERALISTIYDALSHPRDNTGARVTLPAHPDPNDEGEKYSRMDLMLVLNRICVWLFLCTHQEPSDDARDVIPNEYRDPTVEELEEPDDLDILDVTEISLDMQGLLSSPQTQHTGNDAITSREAAALWLIAFGSFKGTSNKKDYDKNIKSFVLGLITVAHMKYSDAMKCINDAVQQAHHQPRARNYHPSPEVMSIVVDFEHTQQTSTFLEYQMASSTTFLAACHATNSRQKRAYARGANEFHERNGEGKGVSIAALAAKFTHSVLTNNVDLKRARAKPLIHMSQKRRREEAANLASTSGLRDDSDQQPSAFKPVVPKAKKTTEQEEKEQ